MDMSTNLSGQKDRLRLELELITRKAETERCRKLVANSRREEALIEVRLLKVDLADAHTRCAQTMNMCSTTREVNRRLELRCRRLQEELEYEKGRRLAAERKLRAVRLIHSIPCMWLTCVRH